MEANVDQMECYYPTREERDDFVQDATADILNPDHHLYTKIYAALYYIRY
jgi:hypothetical protein